MLRASRENLYLPGRPRPRPERHRDRGRRAEGRFGSARLLALDLYPAAAALGFDSEEHRELCRALAPSTDLLSRGMPAKGFGFGGVLRERAYHDALRDLATPAMGHPPLVRIAALDGDGAAAYQRHRPELLALPPG